MNLPPLLQRIVDCLLVRISPYHGIAVLIVESSLSGEVVERYKSSPGFMLDELGRLGVLSTNSFALFPKTEKKLIAYLSKDPQSLELAQKFLRVRGVETRVLRVHWHRDV